MDRDYKIANLKNFQGRILVWQNFFTGSLWKSLWSALRNGTCIYLVEWTSWTSHIAIFSHCEWIRPFKSAFKSQAYTLVKFLERKLINNDTLVKPYRKALLKKVRLQVKIAVIVYGIYIVFSIKYLSETLVVFTKIVIS